MNRLAYGTLMVAWGGWLDDAAWAVVPPSTTLETPPAHLSPADWLLYGSVVIVLIALAIAAIALLTWLVRALFARRGSMDAAMVGLLLALVAGTFGLIALCEKL